MLRWYLKLKWSKPKYTCLSSPLLPQKTNHKTTELEPSSWLLYFFGWRHSFSRESCWTLESDSTFPFPLCPFQGSLPCQCLWCWSCLCPSHYKHSRATSRWFLSGIFFFKSLFVPMHSIFNAIFLNIDYYPLSRSFCIEKPHSWLLLTTPSDLCSGPKQFPVISPSLPKP